MKQLHFAIMALYLTPTIMPISLIKAAVGVAQIGDPQPYLEAQKKAKIGHVEHIIKILAANKAANPTLQNRTYAAAFPGDLIDGQDVNSYRFWFWFLKWFPCWQKGKGQTADFEQNYLKPLDKAGIKTFLGAGNHDFADPTETALKLIKKRHGKLYYAQKINNSNLHYINCGVYPDKKTVLPWLKKQLEKINGEPVIIAFHYNILGNHNAWWSQEERQEFLNAIRGKNVQALMTGHVHETSDGSIEGIPVICSAGAELPVSLFDDHGKYEKTIFFTRQQDNSFRETLVFSRPVYTVPSTSKETAERKKNQRYINNNY